MNEQRPAPFTPGDCDLTDFEFMPVMVRRLLKSDTWSLGTGEERAAAVALWFESWHQVPAGSLPSDDRLLKRLADSDKWAKAKAQALRGWVLCSDGRLYHPIVAQKALEAWIEKLLNSISGATGNAKRWQVTINTTADVQRLRGAVDMLVKLDPQTRMLRKKSVLNILGGSPPDITRESPPDSPPDPSCASPPDSPGDRKGEGKGEGEGLYLNLLPEVGDPPAGEPPAVHRNGRVNGNGAIPPCDHEAILALWRERMPVNPQPAKWTEPRRRHLQARWRELFAEGTVHTREEALAWFATFFGYLAKSEFLTGRVKPREAGRPPFFAELPWVLLPEHFVQCVEGRYHQQEH